MVNIHTSHRLILLLPAVIYLVLVVLTAIIPAQQARDAYPPDGGIQRSALVEQGRQVYIAYGCVNCHTQQIRGDPSKAISVEGERIVPVLSADRRFGLDAPPGAEHYANDDPPLLGSQRTGPDLLVVGSRMPSFEWHYWHLYDPRSVSPDSVMEGVPWLFETEATYDPEEHEGYEEVLAPEALGLPEGRLYASPKAKALVEYLLSLQRPRGEG
jgi:cytochrome c oxidase cbb3-type subunit 2